MSKHLCRQCDPALNDVTEVFSSVRMIPDITCPCGHLLRTHDTEGCAMPGCCCLRKIRVESQRGTKEIRFLSPTEESKRCACGHSLVVHDVHGCRICAEDRQGVCLRGVQWVYAPSPEVDQQFYMSVSFLEMDEKKAQKLHNFIRNELDISTFSVFYDDAQSEYRKEDHGL